MGIGLGLLAIVSGIATVLHHRRQNHEDEDGDHHIGAHIPVIADAVLSPLTPIFKYAHDRPHEVLVEPPEVEGSTPVFELFSPCGEKSRRELDASNEGTC